MNDNIKPLAIDNIEGNFTEIHCKISLKEKCFECGGAYWFLNRMIAYYSKKDNKPVITLWHNEILTDKIRILNKIPLYSGLSDSIIYLRFEYLGKVFSGVTLGNGFIIKAKLTKLKSIYA